MLRAAAVALLALAAGLAVSPAVRAQTQTELTAEACADRDAADRELNTTYRRAMGEAGDARAQRALRDAQRAWIAFRDAHTAALFPVPAGSSTRVQYGSIYPMRLCTAQAAITRARTEQLLARLDCDEGDFCDQ
ncbi:MAG TPA: lysozyme inhibitor LprI family protein [Rubricoccaceae bacterium]|jgi:uncharacterized protein YecT (DUF1311 family)